MIVLNITLWTSLFCLVDKIFTYTGLDGIYYFIHAGHNALITYSTAQEVYKTFTEFQTIASGSPNYYALELVFALHIYHILFYWRKFRYDDWLHHALMIGVALPIGGVLPAGTLLGFSLFFTTGLPGGIDYFLLFLTRNNWIYRNTEKKINNALAVWIRSPGCVAHAALTIAYLNTQKDIGILYYYLGVLTAALNYWNGQYFMSQVVYDAGKRDLFD
jgi:hypothetical protein